jgi:hypothetical protein
LEEQNVEGKKILVMDFLDDEDSEGIRNAGLLLCIGVEDCPRLYHFIGHGVFSCPEGQTEPPAERGQGKA